MSRPMPNNHHTAVHFQLVRDWIDGGGPQGPVSAEHERLIVPTGVSRLRVPASGEIGWSATRSTGRGPLFLFEPILDVRPPRLVAVSPPGAVPRANGLPVPQLAILFVGDQFQPRPDLVLHIMLHQRPYVGPAGPDWIGRRCPVCLSEFASTSQVYRCNECGAAMHFESPDGPDGSRLDCATEGMSCGSCRQQISLTEGLTYLPERYHV